MLFWPNVHKFPETYFKVLWDAVEVVSSKEVAEKKFI